MINAEGIKANQDLTFCWCKSYCDPSANLNGRVGLGWISHLRMVRATPWIESFLSYISPNNADKIHDAHNFMLRFLSGSFFSLTVFKFSAGNQNGCLWGSRIKKQKLSWMYQFIGTFDIWDIRFILESHVAILFAFVHTSKDNFSEPLALN